MDTDWKYFEISEEKCEEWQLAQIFYDNDDKPLNRVYVLLIACMAAYVKWDGCVSLQEFELEDRTENVPELLKASGEAMHVCSLSTLIQQLQTLDNIAAREVYRE